MVLESSDSMSYQLIVWNYSPSHRAPYNVSLDTAFPMRPHICPVKTQISHCTSLGTFFNPKIQKSVLFLHKNIRCGYSLEMPHWDTFNEYPQQMFSWRNKKNIYRIPTPLPPPYLDLGISQHIHTHTDNSLCFLQEDALNPWLPKECPVMTDHTAWMHRLVWVLAGCTRNFVGNDVFHVI